MCKLAGWTSTKAKPLNKSAADRGLIAAAKAISCQRDGFGFAQSNTGLHGRFVTPSDFGTLDALPQLLRAAGTAANAFAVTDRAEQTGNYRPTGSMVIHGRTATMGRGLINTHPFKLEGWTLAHNGVIDWTGKKSESHKSVTCDSQHLLLCMTENATDETRKKDLESIQGYAAFIALAPDGRLIVAVDNIASLHAAITNKGRWIFGTTAEIVRSIGRAWGTKNLNPFAVRPWSWLSFGPNATQPTVTDWKHKGSSWNQDKFSSRSLGKSRTRTESQGYWYEEVPKKSTTTTPDETEAVFTSFPDYEGSQ
jgi:predicted glutamine amidotransferase